MCIQITIGKIFTIFGGRLIREVVQRKEFEEYRINIYTGIHIPI